jgi:acryloyl-coenzyme A reductase
VHLPASIDFVRGAAIPCGIGTPLHAIRRAGVGVGSRVLVTGATGGVGMNAVRLARASGAERVVAVVRDGAARSALCGAGATDVVVAAGVSEPVDREVRALLPEGVDAVLECVGTPTLDASVRSVRPGGRVAVIGNVEPLGAGPSLGRLIVREVEVVGSAHASVDELERAVSMVAEGAIDPAIAAVMPVTEAAAAHELLERGGVGGKVVLTLAI